MADLSVDDLIAYSGGRLEDNDETTRVLSSALTYARNYCGWHVTPVREADEVTVDGPGGRTLTLPTKRLLDLTEVTEDDTELDVTTLYWSTLGRVTKTSGTWTCKPRAVVATIDHGFTEDEAADWRGAVLGIANRMSLAVAGQFSSMTAGPYQVVVGSAELLLPGDAAIMDRYSILGAWA